MRILEEKPPNYQELLQVFPVDKYRVFFPWGDTLYNPKGGEIPADILFHEIVHQRQQGDSPEKWWNQYIYNKDFRLEQEIEAYASQLNWLKNLKDKKGKHLIPSKAITEALDEMASNLSSPLYNVNVSFNEAKTIIRKRAKRMSNL